MSKAKCEQCGACCMTSDVDLGEITPENEAVKMDKLKWFAFHRCDTGVTIREDGKKHAVLRIPLTCQHLVLGPKGKYVCKIYNDPKKPKLCSDFVCPRMSQGTPTNKLEMAAPAQG